MKKLGNWEICFSGVRVNLKILTCGHTSFSSSCFFFFLNLHMKTISEIVTHVDQRREHFFFICLFHVHFSPDNFHLFRLVFTFFSLCLRISCLLLFVRLFFFQCCSLCFWIYIFFLCIVCFVFSAFFETYFARA